MKDQIKNIFIFLFIIFSAAFILRGFNIFKNDLWFDELMTDSYSVKNININSSLTGKPERDIFLQKASNDQHSMLYYALVYGFSSVFSGGKSIRVVSLLFSMLFLLFFYKLAKMIFNKEASLIALLLACFSPVYIWYAQEARAYALIDCMSILTIYLFFLALQTNKIIYWAGFTIASILALYLSPYVIFLLLATGAVIYSKNNIRNIKIWSFCIVLVFLSLFPALFIFVKQLYFVKSSFWLPEPALKDVLLTLAVFNLGYSANFIQLFSGLILFLALFIFGIRAFYRQDKEKASVILLLFLIPLTLVYLISVFMVPIYISRNLFIILPFYYLFIAFGINSIKKRILKTITILGVFSLMLLSIVNYNFGFMLESKNGKDFYKGIHLKKNYTQALTFLFSRIKPRDLIVTTDIQAYIIVMGYTRNIFKPKRTENFWFCWYPELLGTYEGRSLGVGNQLNYKENEAPFCMYFSKEAKKRLIKSLQPDSIASNRIWLISSDWNFNPNLSFNSRKIRSDLLGYYKSAYSVDKDGFQIELLIK